MAKAKLYYTTPEYLETLPIQSGNIIFVPDANTVCLDMKDQRFSYQTIKNFETEEERADTPFPNDGFYFVEETGVIWRYSKNRWKQLTSSNIKPVVYCGTVDDFPIEGTNDTLYYTDEGIYNWKEQLSKYNIIANANKWDRIS